MTDVVITGFGATTPLGADAPSTWQGLVEGRNGVHTLDHEWAEGLPVPFAAEVVDEPGNHIPRPRARRLDRSSQLALVAAREAWADAGLSLPRDEDGNPVDNGVDPDRLIVSVATGIGGLHSLLGQWDVQKDKGFRRVSPFTIPMLMANAPAANIGLEFHATGGIHTPVSACASSSEAISLGLDQIRLGRADIV
ncbi:beta-ketoacyl synthase N-terminal-like domain-containing protein, partial [Cutibacterium acnes]